MLLIPKQDVVDIILRGDITQMDNNRLPNSKNKVAVFISSTFTDTKTERNALIRGNTQSESKQHHLA